MRKLYQLPQLKSVKSLYIEIYDLTITQFCLWIGGLFPNLNKLTIKVQPDFDQAKQFRETVQTEFAQLEELQLINQDCLSICTN